MIQPSYTESVIIGIKYKKIFSWYISEPELWYLDYNKAGYGNSEYPEKRKDISILNENTITKFLQNIKELQTSTEDIRLAFIKDLELDKINAVYDYNPCFLIDFDSLIFYSNYPELISFEEYIPDNWRGYFQSFYNYVPSPYRYWEHKGENYLVGKD